MLIILLHMLPLWNRGGTVNKENDNQMRKNEQGTNCLRKSSNPAMNLMKVKKVNILFSIWNRIFSKVHSQCMWSLCRRESISSLCSYSLKNMLTYCTMILCHQKYISNTSCLKISVWTFVIWQISPQCSVNCFVDINNVWGFVSIFKK